MTYVIKSGDEPQDAVHLCRLQRLLKTRQAWAAHLLSELSFFSVIDSYPIELIFPVRQGRSDKQVAKKGRDKGRWSVGVKLCWLINEAGKVVAWDFDTMNVSDKTFYSLVEPFAGQTVVRADYGVLDKTAPTGPVRFRDREGSPEPMKFCPKGTWFEAYEHRNCVLDAHRRVQLQKTQAPRLCVHQRAFGLCYSDVQRSPRAVPSASSSSRPFPDEHR